MQSHTRGDGPAALTDAGHLAEVRSTELAIRLAEHRDVQGIDRLSAELERLNSARASVWKPLALTVSLYLPGGIAGIT